jgi:hypothetical protein
LVLVVRGSTSGRYTLRATIEWGADALRAFIDKGTIRLCHKPIDLGRLVLGDENVLLVLGRESVSKNSNTEDGRQTRDNVQIGKGLHSVPNLLFGSREW